MNYEKYLSETYTHLNSTFKVTYPKFEELHSTLNVNSSNYLDGSFYVSEYNLLRVTSEVDGNGEEDLDSTLFIRVREDLDSTLIVSQIAEESLEGYFKCNKSGQDDFVGHFEIDSSSMISGYMYVSESNKMRVVTSLIYLGDNDLPSFFKVKGYTDNTLKGHLKVYSQKDEHLEAYLEIKDRGNEYLHGYLDTISSSHLEGFLIVNPHNKMRIVFDVERPKQQTEKIPPIIDSTVRGNEKYKYINFGKETTLLASTKPDDPSETFINFDIKFLQKAFIENQGLYLKLYYYGNPPRKEYLISQRVTEEWKENSITYANRPTKNKETYPLIEINEDEKYVLFDVTEYLNHIENEDEGYGFVIKYTAPNKSTVSFSSREGEKSPELVSLFIDHQPVLSRTSDIPATMYIRAFEAEDLHGYLTVTKSYGDSDLEGHLMLHQIDEPIYMELSAYLDVSLRDLNATFKTKVDGVSDLNATVTIRASDTLELNAFVEASVPFIHGQLEVFHREDLHGFLTCRAITQSDLVSTLDVSVPEIESSVFLRYYEDFRGYLGVLGDGQHDIIANVEISRPEITATLTAREVKDLDLHGHFFLEEKRRNDLEAYFEISNPNIISTIKARSSESNDITGTFIIRESSFLDAMFEVSNPEIIATMNVLGRSTLEGYFNVSVPELNGHIIFKSFDINDLDGFLYPRVTGVNDMFGTFRGRNKATATGYYYII